MMSRCYVLVNFGGPRNLGEVRSFLTELLTDRDVIRTSLPRFIEYPLFYFIAAKRARKVSEDYRVIGGKSPIYEDTEHLKTLLESKLDGPILTFHRYLKNTHLPFIETIKKRKEKELYIFPLFPQFTYATTGSIARFFAKHVPFEILRKMKWLPSYPAHPLFVASHVKRIREYLDANALREEEVVLLFSAHGLPKKFIEEGDPYIEECRSSFNAIRAYFPKVLSRLSYQSQFGKEEWVRPYTWDVSKEILSWHEGRKHILFIPLSFTSDHIETLFEIEDAYMPLIRENGLIAHRIPALNLSLDWVEAIPKIINGGKFVSTEKLIRKA